MHSNKKLGWVISTRILASSTRATSEKCAANNSGTDSSEIYLPFWSNRDIFVILHAEFNPVMFLRTTQVCRNIIFFMHEYFYVIPV